MKKLRAKFWTDSKAFIEWCDDEELRVLRDKANKELESRLAILTGKFDESEDRLVRGAKDKLRKKVRGL